jgi:hypothetical protein
MRHDVALTDEKGSFSFQKLKPGSYTLWAKPDPKDQIQEGVCVEVLPLISPRLWRVRTSKIHRSVLSRWTASRGRAPLGAQSPHFVHVLPGHLIWTEFLPATTMPRLLTASSYSRRNLPGLSARSSRVRFQYAWMSARRLLSNFAWFAGRGPIDCHLGPVTK